MIRVFLTRKSGRVHLPVRWGSTVWRNLSFSFGSLHASPRRSLDPSARTPRAGVLSGWCGRSGGSARRWRHSRRLPRACWRCARRRAHRAHCCAGCAASNHPRVLAPDGARVQPMPLSVPAPHALRPDVQAERLHAHGTHAHHAAGRHVRERLAQALADSWRCRDGGHLRDEPRQGAAGDAKRDGRLPAGIQRLPRRRTDAADGRVHAAHLRRRRGGRSASTTWISATRTTARGADATCSSA